MYATLRACCENGADSAASIASWRSGAAAADDTAYPVRALTRAPGRFTRTVTRRYDPALGDRLLARQEPRDVVVLRLVGDAIEGGVETARSRRSRTRRRFRARGRRAPRCGSGFRSRSTWMNRSPSAGPRAVGSGPWRRRRNSSRPPPRQRPADPARRAWEWNPSEKKTRVLRPSMDRNWTISCESRARKSRVVPSSRCAIARAFSRMIFSFVE